MLSSWRGGKHGGTFTTQKNAKFSSDENVLITEVLASPSDASKRTLSDQMDRKDTSNNTERLPTPDLQDFPGNAVHITKTVEIKQRFELARISQII